jgi:sestrin
MHTSPRVSKGSLDYTLRFFHTLLTQDEAARKQALDRILWQLENSLQGSDQGQLFVAHIATITRFASEVPFSDVREAFSRLLERAETTLPVHSPVYSMVKEYQRLRRPIFSRFIPNDQLPTVQNANSVTLRLFTDNFLFTGRISTVVRVMAFFPSYLEAYIQSYRAIMRRPGPLPETWRNYLGLMAGARLRCSYIVHMQETEFLLHGGDIRWLESDENVPPKLLVIRELNAILAHQPWLLKSEHLQRLAHPASSLGGQVSWSLSECVLAILIFSHFHSLAGFIEGCGLCPDIDMDSRDSLVRLLLTREQDGGGTEEEEMATKTNDALQSPPSEVEATRQLVEKLKRAIILQEDTSYSDSGDQQQFAKSASIDSNSHEHRSWNSDGSFTEAMEAKYSRIAGFTEYYPLKHEDFDVNSKTYKIFHIHEYNWSDHGYALINAFYEDGELASLLDKQFDIIYHLTDNSIGMNANVDTSIFRRAIWVYVHRLMGIMHDDYDYRLVNLILKQPLKAFIKKVACKPETISRNDFERMGLALRPEEKVQIVLLSMEARKQAELLYGLHAIMKWMNQDSDD